MSSKNIKRWITINGNHVPVYEDGTLGGVAEKFTSYDGEEHEIHAEKATGKTVSDLKDDLKKNYGLEIDSADAHDMQNSRSFNDEKVTMYDKDGNEYEGTYNKYSDSGREIVDIKPKSGKSSSKSVEVDQDELMDVVDKYNATSRPISGSWDTETEHEQKTIADHFGISMDEAKQVMKERLGFEDEQFESKGNSSKDKPYHVADTDEYGGEYIDEGKVGDYKIGDRVTYEDGKKGGVITKAHKYSDGSISYNVEDDDGDGHQVRMKDLTLDDKPRTEKRDPVKEAGVSLLKVQDIAERYIGSKPVSGDWDTEGGHLANTLSKELGISKKQAEDIMVDTLGWERSDIQYPKESSSDKSIKVKDNGDGTYDISKKAEEKYSDTHRSKTGPLAHMTDDQVMDAALKGDRNSIDEMSIRGLSTTKDLQNYKKRKFVNADTTKYEGQAAPAFVPRVEGDGNQVVKIGDQEYHTEPLHGGYNKEHPGDYIEGHTYVPHITDFKSEAKSFFVDNDGNIWHDGSQYLNSKSQKQAAPIKVGDKEVSVSKRVGYKELNEASVGTRLEDNNGDVWKKTGDHEVEWHKEGSEDRASAYYLSQSADINSSRFIDDRHTSATSKKSIKVGDKEVGIHDTRMERTVKAIKAGDNNLKGMPIGDLKELAIKYAGKTSSQISGMSADELRRMLLSMWKK